MARRIVAVAITALALPVLGVTAPRAAAAQPQSEVRFADMDRNGDGVVTRQEWRGSAASFERHDWNRDGILSGDELRPGTRQDRGDDGPDHAPNRLERNQRWTEDGFRDLDHDGNGRLTANEWHYDAETFRRIDRDQDGAVTLAEYLGNGWDDDRGDNFDDLDWNNDGRVERSEWHGGADAFRALDRNGDGVLTRYEMAGNDRSFDSYDEFERLDVDRDGALARGEWHGSRAEFTQRDRNRDGMLSRSEFESGGGAFDAVAGTTGQASRTLRVDARQRWTSTGITVRPGDTITVDARGDIQMSDDSGDLATPAGSRRGRRAPDAPVVDQLAGGLIVRIGDYPPMFLGDRGAVTAPVGGTVYLGVNDDYLQDNRGEFTVTLSVEGRPRR